MTALLALEPRRPVADDGPARFFLPAAFGATAVLGAFGAIGSFTKVAAEAEKHHIDPSWLLPIGVDGAIAVFTALDLALAREGKRVGWLRWFAWGLIGATVALNVSGETDAFGYVAHAALPLLWAATVEAAKAAMITRATEAPDRIPLARWVYAPLPTLLIHRRMRLWQVTSYDRALELDTRRVMARCDLIEAHGWKWRWTPDARRDRALYRRGQPTAPTASTDEGRDETALGAGKASAPPPGAARPAPARRPPARRRPTKATGRRPPATDDELVAAAVALAVADPAVLGGWKSMAVALRGDGHPIGTERAPAVLELARARLKETTPDAP